MDILFVIPPLSERQHTGVFGKLFKIGSIWPPQGVCILASILRARGHRLEILDSQALTVDFRGVLERIVARPPDILCLTASTVAIESAAALSREAKKALPGIVAIVGGPHVSALPRRTFEEFPHFDFGVIGEGEETLPALVGKIENKQDGFQDLDGIVYAQDGRITITQSRALIRDLDNLPFPAWDLLPPITKYYRQSAQRFISFPIASLITSRGCPHECSFCDQSIFGRTYRANGAEYVLDLILHLKSSFGINGLIFNDDLFAARRSRVMKICESMISKNLGLSWSCSGRVGGYDEAMLKLMKKAGCWQIAYGFESGSERVLDVLKKRTDLRMALEQIRLTRLQGISAKGLFMIGIPTETAEDIEKTVDFSLRLGLGDMQITFFTPYPGTQLFQYVTDHEGFVPRWPTLNTVYPAYTPSGITAETLIQAQKKAFGRFYLRPRIIAQYLWRSRNPRFLFQVVREAFYFVQFLIQKDRP